VMRGMQDCRRCTSVGVWTVCTPNCLSTSASAPKAQRWTLESCRACNAACLLPLRPSSLCMTAWMPFPDVKAMWSYRVRLCNSSFIYINMLQSLLSHRVTCNFNQEQGVREWVCVGGWVMWPYLSMCHVMHQVFFHDMSCHVMSCHVMSCHVMHQVQCHALLHLVNVQ